MFLLVCCLFFYLKGPRKTNFANVHDWPSAVAVDADPLSARNETEFVGISALEVQSDISALSLYTACANIGIGVLKLNVALKDVEDSILRGPEPHPTLFPVDKHGNKFSTNLLSFSLKNNEIIPRDWLVLLLCLVIRDWLVLLLCLEQI